MKSLLTLKPLWKPGKRTGSRWLRHGFSKNKKVVLGVVNHQGRLVDSYTGIQLSSMVKLVSDKLQLAGVINDMRVAFSLKNTPLCVLVNLALIDIGAVICPLNSAMKLDEYTRYLALLKPAVFICESGDTEGISKVESLKLGYDLAVLKLKIQRDSTTYVEISGSVTSDYEPIKAALLLFTGGTTGLNKLVPISIQNMRASIDNIQNSYGFTIEDVSFLVMPLFHVHGLMAGLLAPLANGATVIMQDTGKFSAAGFWDAMAVQGVTYYTAVPTIHQIVLNIKPSSYAPLALRLVRSCSSELTKELKIALETELRSCVVQAYGMTEACHQIATQTPNTHGEYGTVGKPAGTRVYITNECYEELPRGCIGNICISGANIIKGYLDPVHNNSMNFSRNLFFTGDRGYIDQLGDIYLTGRAKEMINYGGEKLSPIEIEGALRTHPSVKDAVVFPYENDHYGEVPHAVVVLKNPDDPITVDEIKGHVYQLLSLFKVPREIHFVTELPTTSVGKVQRNAVKQVYGKPQSVDVPVLDFSAAHIGGGVPGEIPAHATSKQFSDSDSLSEDYGRGSSRNIVMPSCRQDSQTENGGNGDMGGSKECGGASIELLKDESSVCSADVNVGISAASAINGESHDKSAHLEVSEEDDEEQRSVYNTPENMEKQNISHCGSFMSVNGFVSEEADETLRK